MLADAFLKRSAKALETAVQLASPEALRAALEAATSLGGVASLLQELLQQAGGGLTSAQVAKASALTRQAVDKRRSRRALLAVPSGSGDYLYPACQFDKDGPIEGLSEVLQAFEWKSPWMQLSALMAPSPALRGKSILDAVKNGDIDKAKAVAESLGEQ